MTKKIPSTPKEIFMSFVSEFSDLSETEKERAVAYHFFSSMAYHSLFLHSPNERDQYSTEAMQELWKYAKDQFSDEIEECKHSAEISLYKEKSDSYAQSNNVFDPMIYDWTEDD